MSATANAGDKLKLTGHVFENLSKTPLQGASVRLIDSKGVVIDSTKTRGRMQIGKVIKDMSQFTFEVPRTEGTSYTIEASFEGYDYGSIRVEINNLGRRELKRDLPTIYLKRAKVLKEVTVTASKIKFYHKNDTLIYNADAFQLAEGSMLDALISQLPGVELKDDGQIFVNGKYVESLLLNGRDFFGKNNQLLLDNLGAYTVKDIAVYDRAGRKSEFHGRDMGDKDFVMDVRLKKEYQHGWMVNLEAGGGTSNRYMGRAFGLHFTPYSQIALFGNINNLNDKRKPGQNTSWTPETMPKGSQKEQQVGVDYNVRLNRGVTQIQGNVIVSHTSENDITTTEQTNLLSTGNTYEYMYNQAKNSTTTIKQNNNIYTKSKYVSTSIDEGISYTKYKNNSGYSAAAFDDEMQSMNRDIIDEIYSSAYVGQTEKLMNRALQNTIVDGHTFNASLKYGNDWKFKKNQDSFYYTFTGSYKEDASDSFKDYTINYGKDATPAYKSNEYYRSKPNRSYRFGTYLGYTYWLNDDNYIQPEYIFNHETRNKDSQRFLLDRLEEDGVFGTLPDGYLSAIDNDNSFTSRYNDNTHILSARIHHWSKGFWFRFTPQVHIFDQSLDYNRGGKDYTVNRNRTSFALASWTEMSYTLAFKNDEFGNARSAQTLKLEYLITPRTPDLLYLVPIQDAVDPLNIYEGAESLRNELLHEINLSWIYKPSGSRLNNVLLLGYQINQNMLTRGYCYDSQTGVRTIRSYNTNGNWNRFINNTLSLQFGSKGQFSLSSVSRAEQSHLSDMIGINTTDPTRTTVKNWFLTENFKLDWQIGKQKIGARVDAIYRDTRSTRDSFTPFHATTLNYGVSGVFRLPYNFGFSTDLTCYTRRGYADEALNTTDVVWNARLSYTAFKNRWVFMLDGFDILHQLSNVTYGVTAQARTVTYTNVLPRYFMLHVQYRLNIQPKKRK